MPPSAEQLRISRHLAPERETVFLVSCTKAISLCEREGFLKVAPSHTLWLLGTMERRSCSEVRAFVSRMRLSPLPLSRLGDQELLDLVRGHVRTGRLAGVRPDGTASQHASDETAQQRRLVRKIEQGIRGRLGLAGRAYKLVADVDLGKLPGRDNYEVVRHDEAVEVLAHLAAQHATSELPELLRQASEKLTRDWRPPLSPDGLVLLRRIIAQTARPVDSWPALTPSQLRKLAKNDWIEIEVVDQDDEPYIGHYRLELADKSLREGELGEDGLLAVYETESGSCTLAIGEVKEPAAEADAEEGDTAPAEEQPAEGDPVEEPELPDARLAEAEDFDELDFEDEGEPETKPIFLRLHMDPGKAAALKEKFRLFSTDGSYSQTEATDRIPGNAYMDLMFDGAPTNLSYSLEISGPGIKPRSRKKWMSSIRKIVDIHLFPGGRPQVGVRDWIDQPSPNKWMSMI